MTESFKETVVLLSAIQYRDFDLIVNFLSETQGKMTSVIYGGRKINKASSFLYHPGDLLEIEFQKSETREFIKLNNSIGIKLLKLDQFPYDRFLFHSYLLELVGRITKPEMSAKTLFNLLTLNNLLIWEKNTKFTFICWALWQVIIQGGFQLDIVNCGSCDKKIWKIDENQQPVFRKETYQLVKNSGQITCSNCTPNIKSNEIITPAMIKILWIFNSLETKDSIHRLFPQEVIHPLIKILNQYLLQCFEIKPKSLSLFLSILV